MKRGEVSHPGVGFLSSGKIGKATCMHMNPYELVATLEGVIT